jgi:hypothetical protein
LSRFGSGGQSGQAKYLSSILAKTAAAGSANAFSESGYFMFGQSPGSISIFSRNKYLIPEKSL